MPVSQPDRRRVRERSNLLCEYCHANERWQFVRFTIDHVLPVSKGGADDQSNLALACRNCNERRGNRVEATDSKTGELVPVFNPRVDSWTYHFIWDASKTRILGQTATGRATIQLLDLNDELHEETCLRIRKRDVDDGFHPPPDDSVLAE
ncbi:MAG: hypothetical protein ACI8UO_003881 [Verrucomicrobiales bacterium]|jgi:hypothetical protein